VCTGSESAGIKNRPLIYTERVAANGNGLLSHGTNAQPLTATSA